mmetsp:Transcript_42905/g.104676  ORF Transcript_42905/g.104676 Transcript_42905/m.104676 type:complete len:339 (+) Transcript_42905:238-1254(+)
MEAHVGQPARADPRGDTQDPRGGGEGETAAGGGGEDQAGGGAEEGRGGAPGEAEQGAALRPPLMVRLCCLPRSRVGAPGGRCLLCEVRLLCHQGPLPRRGRGVPPPAERERPRAGALRLPAPAEHVGPPDRVRTAAARERRGWRPPRVHARRARPGGQRGGAGRRHGLPHRARGPAQGQEVGGGGVEPDRVQVARQPGRFRGGAPVAGPLGRHSRDGPCRRPGRSRLVDLGAAARGAQLFLHCGDASVRGDVRAGRREPEPVHPDGHQLGEQHLLLPPPVRLPGQLCARGQRVPPDGARGRPSGGSRRGGAHRRGPGGDGCLHDCVLREGGCAGPRDG